jgi:UDP-N-acetylglucosamine acyltransferase
MAKIHPTAIVDAQAEMGDDVTVGAYCIIKGRVQIGAGTVVQEHCHIHGHSVLGRGCRIGPAAYIGLDPQDLKYKGAETSMIIGDDVVIRETASVHRSTISDAAHATRIGDRCFIMGSAHVGHDCTLAKDVVLANGVLLAGHVNIGERAFLGGGFALHQFCSIGRLSVVAGNEALSQDVPPFAAIRDRSLKGYNAVGCRRAGFSQAALVAIRAAYTRLREHRQMTDAVAAIRAQVPLVPEVVEILDFIAASRRGIVPSMVGLRLRHSITADEMAEDD